MLEFPFIKRAQIAESKSATTMLSAIDYPYDEDNSKEAILVTGCPGSGKTTVISNRALVLTKEKTRFFYLVYPRLLLTYLKLVLKNGEINPEMIETVHTWFGRNFRTKLMDADKLRYSVVKDKFTERGKMYNELIVDEGQDLWNELFELLPIVSPKLTISCDNAQDVMGQFGSPEIDDQIKKTLEENGFLVQPFPLTTNFRNTPQIYNFAKALVPDMPTANIHHFHRTEGALPQVVICKDDKETLYRVNNIIKSNTTKNVGVLCESVREVNRVRRWLEVCGISRAYYHSDMTLDVRDHQLSLLKETNVVVTTHKSCKGLEFEIVVIPFADKMKNLSADNTVMKGYYVACTRAREELYLICTSQIPDVIAKIESTTHKTFTLIDRTNFSR